MGGSSLAPLARPSGPRKWPAPPPTAPLTPPPFFQAFHRPARQRSAAPRPLAACLFPTAQSCGADRPRAKPGPARTPTPGPLRPHPRPFRVTHLRPRPRPKAQGGGGRGEAGRLGPPGTVAFPSPPFRPPPRSATELPPRSSAAPKSKGVRLRHHSKWLSLPGRLRSRPLVPSPASPPFAVARDRRRRLANAAATHSRCRRSRLHGDQVSVRRGRRGLENRAELVEPSKS